MIMLQLIIIVGVFVAVVTGCLCVTAKDSKNDDSNWAYEYEVKPKCFKRSRDRRGSCSGADNMNDFTSKDCASCEYWRGKLNR